MLVRAGIVWACFGATLATAQTVAQRSRSQMVGPVIQETRLETLVYQPSQKFWVLLVRQHLDTARRNLQRRTGRTFLVPVEVHILPNQRAYDRAAGSGVEHSVACAIASERLILINAEKLGAAGEQEIAVTILHEMVHLFLGLLVVDPPPPRWLDEGLAQILSDPYPPLQSASIASYAMLGTTPNLYGLSGRFPRDEAGNRLAYLVSRSVTEFLIRDQFDGSPNALIRKLTGESGPAFVSELQSELMVNALEARWQDSYRTPGGIAMLSLNPNIMMGLGFLALLLAYFVSQRRKRRQQTLDSAMISNPGGDLLILQSIDRRWPPEADLFDEEC